MKYVEVVVQTGMDVGTDVLDKSNNPFTRLNNINNIYNANNIQFEQIIIIEIKNGTRNLCLIN